MKSFPWKDLALQSMRRFGFLFLDSFAFIFGRSLLYYLSCNCTTACMFQTGHQINTQSVHNLCIKNL